MRSVLLLMMLLPLCLLAQQDSVPRSKVDTIITLDQVLAHSAVLRVQPLDGVGVSVGGVDAQQLQNHPITISLVSVANQLPGVRMEERSPGSYRFSIRGSSLRSPFGVRNVKFYLMEDLPFTDASGNTYLNLFDYSGIKDVEVLKGPYASIYGANSGGVVLLNSPYQNVDTALEIHVAAGSFGLVKEDVHFYKKWKKYSLQIDQAYQRSDGYRRNSQMQRHFVQATQKWDYHPKARFTFYHLFSKLQYETPGGLTEAQMNQDPKAARSPTATLPGATQQQSGIFNTTLYNGGIHRWNINNNLTHVVSAFGSVTRFKNPFITNYELRKEYTLGTSTYIAWHKGKVRWKNGYEYLYTFTNFENYGNNRGSRDTLQVADKLKAQQQFLFSELRFKVFGRVNVDLSASLNLFGYKYQNQYPISSNSYQGIAFKPQIMPRLLVNYQIAAPVYLIAIVSRGYSPPTLSEVRPSNNIINQDLQAELGWNYEFGITYLKAKGLETRVKLIAKAYYFQLNDAIVRREDTNNQEYYVNAGGTSQAGLELYGAFKLTGNKKRKVLKNLFLVTTYTFQHFKFKDYEVASTSYSGNWLTGVPRHVATAQLMAEFGHGVSVNLTYNFTSTIPLNDANEVYANSYHLLQARISYQLPIKKREMELYLSGDNLLNQKYSLGNDINAFGGRYFNPAHTINFMGGVRVKL